MELNPKNWFELIKGTLSDWSADKAPRLGAALAYYTIFSISPLLIIVIAIAGFWLGRDVAQKSILNQLQDMIGQQGAEAIAAMVASTEQHPKVGAFATVVAVVMLLAGATGVFIQLQDALNSIWQVKPKPDSGIRAFIKNRFLSFALILGIGFLLVVSLVISAVLAALGKYLGGYLPGWQFLARVLNFSISFGVIAMLFALMFKFLPDVKLRWRDVFTGAVMTALLFTVGKALFAIYLGKSSVASAYGAAGSLIIILLWVYYSSQIFFFGAEFTKVYTRKKGRKVELRKNAMWMSQTEAVDEPKPERNGSYKAETMPLAKATLADSIFG